MSFRSKSVALLRSFTDAVEKENVLPGVKAAVKTAYRTQVTRRYQNLKRPRITGNVQDYYRGVTGS